MKIEKVMKVFMVTGRGGIAGPTLVLTDPESNEAPPRRLHGIGSDLGRGAQVRATYNRDRAVTFTGEKLAERVA
jgi:hypothetical protein